MFYPWYEIYVLFNLEFVEGTSPFHIDPWPLIVNHGPGMLITYQVTTHRPIHLFQIRAGKWDSRQNVYNSIILSMRHKWKQNCLSKKKREITLFLPWRRWNKRSIFNLSGMMNRDRQTIAYAKCLKHSTYGNHIHANQA